MTDYGSIYHEMDVLLKEDMVKMLNKKAAADHLGRSHLRSLAWRVTLGALSDNPADWETAVQADRQRFVALITKHMPPKEVLEAASDPLSATAGGTDDDNPWDEYFKTREMREMIDQDVVRTHPDDEFFCQKPVMNALAEILLVFAKENPELGYSQGMHELLAPVLFAVWTDADGASETVDQSSSTQYDARVYSLVQVLFSPDHVAADAFVLFERLVDRVRPWFVGVKPVTTLSPRSAQEAALRNPTQRTCENIQGVVLRSHDSALAAYLASIDLIPQIYALRWIRVLFSREFDLRSQLLSLWDALFATNVPFERMVELIAVAMLIRVRDRLLQLDLSGCLSLLKDYPADQLDVRDLVQLAMMFHNEGMTVKSLPLGPDGKISFRRPLLPGGSFVPANGPSSSSSSSLSSSTRSKSVPATSFKPRVIRQSNNSRMGAAHGSPATVDFETKYRQLLSANQHAASRLDRIIFVFQDIAREDENLALALAELKVLKDQISGNL